MTILISFKYSNCVSMDNGQCYWMMHCLLISGSRSRVINSESLFVSGSGMHSKYLKFLDICSYASIFRYANDYTRAVQLPSTFNIRRRTYHTLYVSLSQYILQYHISLYFDIDKP